MGLVDMILKCWLGISKAVAEYFGKVEKLLEDLHIIGGEDFYKRLWNCNKCGMCTAVASTAILAWLSSKWIHETAGGSGRETITRLVSGSATGQRWLPLVIYKGKHLYSMWTNHGPDGACGACPVHIHMASVVAKFVFTFLYNFFLQKCAIVHQLVSSCRQLNYLSLMPNLKVLC